MEDPISSSLSPSLRSFLDQEFKAVDDLSRAPELLAQLSSDLSSCEHRLSHLRVLALQKLEAWSSCSSSVCTSLSAVTGRIHDLLLTTYPSTDQSAIESQIDREDLVNQLPLLAEEVARVERVQLYADTTLKLEALVGDLEDAVASIVMLTPTHLPHRLGDSEDILSDLSNRFLMSIQSLQEIEDVLKKMMTRWPQWKRLCLAVDARVDRAIASLRPSAIADYRMKLAAVSWPPPLSTTGTEDVNNIRNPLLDMHGDVKLRFEHSFLTLSTLQAIQCHRNARQPKVEWKSKEYFSEHELLWTVEELVAPIGSRAEYHFLKWKEKPDLIFGLAYQIAQQYAESIDLILQPMLDSVKLAGYSVREEWISAIVVMIVKHLRSHLLGKLAQEVLVEENSQDVHGFFLHIVDLAIAFDKKMRNLASQAVGFLSININIDNSEDIELHMQPIVKCMTAFAEPRDMLMLWASLELADAQNKLKLELQKESMWSATRPHWLGSQNFDGPEYEETKAPQGAVVAMLRLWTLINRCRSIDNRECKLLFIQHVCFPFVKTFVGNALQKCQEVEATTALVEESAIVKVAMCIEATYYCEQKLQEWSEDSFFLELRVLQASMEGMFETKESGCVDNEETWISCVEGSIFDNALACLLQFNTEWSQKLASAIQRSFDAHSQDYQHNKKKWQEEFDSYDAADGSEGLSGKEAQQSKGDKLSSMDVSPNLVDALAVLWSRLSILKVVLGEVIFVCLWRGIAASLDQFLFNEVVLSGAKFSVHGGHQFARDVQAILHVFKPYCLRPASFFPNLSDAGLLLTLPQDEVAALQKVLSAPSSWRIRRKHATEMEGGLANLQEYGIKSISPGTAGKILSNRILSKM